MSDEESCAGDQAALDAMSKFFKRALDIQGIPQGKLRKFRGVSSRGEEVSLTQWLEDFEEAIERYGLNEKEKARCLVAHLTGPAKEEIMCLSSEERSDYSRLLEALKLCFSGTEDMQILSQQFYNRVQKEGEALSEFSRVLKRLYGRMEEKAATEEERNALRQLRDRALKDRFSRGAKEAWVRRELRRIDHATDSFNEMRKEALVLFQEHESQSLTSFRVRGAQVLEESGTTPDVAPSARLETLEEGQTQLVRDVNQLKDSVSGLGSMAGELAALRSAVDRCTNQMRGVRPFKENVICYRCRGRGHYQAECRAPAAGLPQQRQGNHSQHQGN